MIKQLTLLFASFLLHIIPTLSQDLLVNFPTIEPGTSYEAEQLLGELQWDELKAYCDSTDNHYARIRDNGGVRTYSYVRQGYVASFEVVVFDDKVLEFRSAVDPRSNIDQVFLADYFDRELFQKYLLSNSLFNDSKWDIPVDEWINYSDRVIQAYYALLGFNTSDEYGWTCEYSAASFPTQKRRAIIDLINHQRRDFILKLLEHPNIQTQLYAADALIYLDMIGYIQSVDMQNHNGSKRSKRYLLKYSPKYELSRSTWNKIYEIRDSNQEVITCQDGTGSYKQYRANTQTILSKESISQIYENYSFLSSRKYLWR